MLISSLTSSLLSSLTSSLIKEDSVELVLINPVTAGRILQIAAFQDGKTKAELVDVDGAELVSNWKDFSGDVNNVLQVTPTEKPTFITNGINGNPAILFNGSDNLLQRTTFTGGGLTQPNTIFIVWEIPTLAGATKKIIDGGGAGSRHVIELHADDKWHMWAGSFASAGSVIAINTPYITSSIFNTSSSEGYLNGVLDITGDVNVTGFDGITIGARFDSTGHLNIKIGEIIIYDRLLTTNERLSVQNYLSDKWI